MAPRISSRRPILCAVLDGAALGRDPHGFAKLLFEAGVDWIQLRDREGSDEALCVLADALVRAAGTNGEHRVIVNRRSDLALAAGAAGVHLGFDAIDRDDARALLGDEALIGASFHSEREVAEAVDGVLSYAHLAPIWDPISKRATRPALGCDVLRRAAALGFPLLAQGGLDADRAEQAVDAGASGIAVTGLLSQARDPAAIARMLRSRLDRAAAHPSG
jgi:thiamine-phosphate pyrophosphorylase